MLWNPYMCQYPPEGAMMDDIKCFGVARETPNQWIAGYSQFDHICLVPLWNQLVVMVVLLLAFASCHPELYRGTLYLHAISGRWYYCHCTVIFPFFGKSRKIPFVQLSSQFLVIHPLLHIFPMRSIPPSPITFSNSAGTLSTPGAFPGFIFIKARTTSSLRIDGSGSVLSFLSSCIVSGSDEA